MCTSMHPILAHLSLLLLVCHGTCSGGSRVWKGGFMRMCTVATTPPFDAHMRIDAMQVAAAVLMADKL